nr:hypothetical protein 14 [bacterium]
MNKEAGRDPKERAGKCQVQVYSRITGFYQPLQSWNAGKRSEFHDRKGFDCTAADCAEKEKKDEYTKQ